jgi:hypothetical protein
VVADPNTAHPGPWNPVELVAVAVRLADKR